MDAALQLALMQKLRSTFESDRTLVAFPMVPVAFSLASLTAVNAGSTSAAQLTDVATWSRLVHLVSSGDLLLGVARPLLWNAMETLFRSAVVIAKGKLSGADQKTLKAAEATL